MPASTIYWLWINPSEPSIRQSSWYPLMVLQLPSNLVLLAGLFSVCAKAWRQYGRGGLRIAEPV